MTPLICVGRYKDADVVSHICVRLSVHALHFVDYFELNGNTSRDHAKDNIIGHQQTVTRDFKRLRLYTIEKTHENITIFQLVNVKSDLFAKFYDGGVEISEKGESAIMICEDLTSAGFVNSRQEVFLDYAHLALMMRKLGEFHALSYKARKGNPGTFIPLAMCFAPNIVSALNDFFPVINKNMQLILQELKNDPKYCTKLTVLEKMNENAPTYAMECVKRYWNSPNSVLSHLYYSPTNILLRHKNDVPIDLKILGLGYFHLPEWTFLLHFILTLTNL
ncbi:hypothetical protein PGB90_003105 [Kerria lacca]